MPSNFICYVEFSRLEAGLSEYKFSPIPASSPPQNKKNCPISCTAILATGICALDFPNISILPFQTPLLNHFADPRSPDPVCHSRQPFLMLCPSPNFSNPSLLGLSSLSLIHSLLHCIDYGEQREAAGNSSKLESLSSPAQQVIGD